MTAEDIAIPVIDLFAGPGGLGEGFSAHQRRDSAENSFRIRLSIERDPIARQTLRLRSFYRQFQPDEVPDAYYACIRGEISCKELFEQHPVEAHRSDKEAWRAELGAEDPSPVEVDRRIRWALGTQKKQWVLIGGPPCQAYSLAGRSRNRGVRGYRPEKDPRHFLYREYLRIIAKHRPAVFVMENVKGLLSSRLRNEYIFAQMLQDLQAPGEAVARLNPGRSKSRVRYRIYSLVQEPRQRLLDGSPVFEPGDFVIRSEDYGIPQARHRVILLGIRCSGPDDLDAVEPKLLEPKPAVPVQQVIGSLPPLRSGLSRTEDSPDHWKRVIEQAARQVWCTPPSFRANGIFRDIKTLSRHVKVPSHDRGNEFLRASVGTGHPEGEWFLDPRIGGACNHSSRGHIVDDLYRYLFAACYARVHGHSPSLADFPEALLPRHGNVSKALSGGYFADRFRVQVADRPARTITSHISKDGHYYIHYDPSQCRSLAVREAARLQTFPDNYFFCGPRTAQYIQVGNAVPACHGPALRRSWGYGQAA